jgi:hypothetical protein
MSCATGYDLVPVGGGELIIAGSIIERLTLTSSGAFEPQPSQP